MTTLREAAQQALEAMEIAEVDPHASDAVYKAITALRAALAEPEPPPEAQTEAEKMAYCAGWWAALAKARKAEPVQEPVAWYHVPHPGNGISPLVSLSQQREPSMYGAVVPLYLKEQL